MADSNPRRQHGSRAGKGREGGGGVLNAPQTSVTIVRSWDSDENVWRWFHDGREKKSCRVVTVKIVVRVLDAGKAKLLSGVVAAGCFFHRISFREFISLLCASWLDLFAVCFFSFLVGLISYYGSRLFYFTGLAIFLLWPWICWTFSCDFSLSNLGKQIHVA